MSFKNLIFCGNYILKIGIYVIRILAIKFLSSFMKNINHLIDIAIGKYFYPVERCKCIFDLSIICILIMLDTPFVR